MQKALLRLLVSGFKHRHRWSQNRESSSPLGTLAIHFVCLDGTVVNRPLKILDTRITDFLSAGFYFTTLDSADAAPFGTISDALNQLNYTMSRTCPQCEGRIVSSLDTNTRSKESRQPKPNEQLRKLRPGMWRDEKQAATRMPGSKEAPAQKQGSYAPDGSGHDSQQPATAAKLQLRNSGFPKAKL